MRTTDYLKHREEILRRRLEARGRRAARETEHHVEAAVREHPFLTLGAGAAAGFLLGSAGPDLSKGGGSVGSALAAGSKAAMLWAARGAAGE